MRCFSLPKTAIALIFIGSVLANAQWVQTNGPYGGTVLSFAITGVNLFAGTDSGGVFLSTNNGATWTAVNSGLTDTTVRSLAASGANLFAGTHAGGVFLSTNNGSSWTAVNSGLTNTAVNSLVTSSANLFAGTGGGVFLSTDNGSTWAAVNSGLTNTVVYSLATSGANLFAGTNGSGVWWRPLSQMLTSVKPSADGMPDHFILGQNYPNPFNPVTKIRFTVPLPQIVSLKIHDLSGREVATLVDRLLLPGDHEAFFNAAILPSGVYFYRLQTASFTETKKLVVLK